MNKRLGLIFLLLLVINPITGNFTRVQISKTLDFTSNIIHPYRSY
jgi:hypothetical protein